MQEQGKRFLFLLRLLAFLPCFARGRKHAGSWRSREGEEGAVLFLSFPFFSSVPSLAPAPQPAPQAEGGCGARRSREGGGGEAKQRSRSKQCNKNK
uniref:hypothetical protein 45 n=1 Tax=Moniliophthora perniciosa TaxID=153609 RepID=UPI0000242351|nr:hypothetical protein 45 [Moniliophthora perniciosa]AAQ74337.1 hypothetical protein 45 [Moniliophthora perniciosa]